METKFNRGPYRETAEDVILRFYNLSQVHFKGAKLGETVNGVLVTKKFKDHVGKLTDHAVADSVCIHTFAQELYEENTRKNL